MKRQVSLVLALIVLSACVTAQGNVAGAYEKQLKAAIGVYEETMIAAGEAQARGIITEEQLTKIADAGRIAQGALETARASLAAYVATKQGDPWGAIEQSQEAMLALLRAASAAGVGK